MSAGSAPRISFPPTPIPAGRPTFPPGRFAAPAALSAQFFHLSPPPSHPRPLCHVGRGGENLAPPPPPGVRSAPPPLRDRQPSAQAWRSPVRPVGLRSRQRDRQPQFRGLPRL